MASSVVEALKMSEMFKLLCERFSTGPCMCRDADGGCWHWEGMHGDDGEPLFFDGLSISDARTVASKIANRSLKTRRPNMATCGDRMCCNPSHRQRDRPDGTPNYRRAPRVDEFVRAGIRRLVLDKGLSQAETGRRMGISASMVRKVLDAVVP